ncbi:MAG: site-specific DNA-methyltransferase [Candidatus Gastranaerophilales bacterium]|nr:site-specific DNA-methyltransferase [Candidatus Gastranaerophilales bacterium]
MVESIEKISGQSLDIEEVEKEKLKSVFPQCFSEGKLDIDKLLNLCGEYIDEDFEKYKFEWKGKAECYRIAGKRSTGTLRPCPDESVNFDSTKNMYIEGDNLEVLKLLQTSYYRKVKMIYIDPPYNTGNDFVYEDDFADPMAKYKEVTQQTTKSNPETMGRYHTNWLNMMYPRLRLASNLLRDDGVIFISIDDNEVTNLRKLCDEVFGEENFIGIIIQNKQNSKNDMVNIQKNHEYIVVYRKSIILDENSTKILPTIISKAVQTRDVYEENGEYYYINDSITTRGEGGVLSARPNLGYTVYYNPNTKDKIAVCDYDVTKATIANDYDELYTDNEDLIRNGYVAIRPPKVRGQLGVWTWSLDKFNNDKKDIIITGKNGSYAVKKRTFVDSSLVQNIDGKLQCSNYIESNIRSIWDFSTNEGTKTLNDVMEDMNTFNNAKNLEMIKSLVKLVNDDNFIILDFFSGSATTAHAVMQLNAEDGGNRQFIMVQLPELCDEKSEAYKAGYKNICEIGKERIRRAGKKILEEKAHLRSAIAKDGFNSVHALFVNSKESEKYQQEEAKVLDVGFKVFKLDTSNLVKWDSTPTQNTDEVYQRMSLLQETIKPDRNDLDVVYETMLKLGIPLDYSVTEVKVNDKKAYSISDDCLVLICLDYGKDGITADDIKTMCDDYVPAKIVASEQAFKDDVALSNAHYILKDQNIEMKLL